MRGRLIALGALCVAATQAASAGTPTRPSVSCLTKAEQPDAFWFRTADNARLAGVVLGRGPRGVVLVHQLYSDLCQLIGEGRSLAGGGYRVLLIDMRGFGRSPAPTRNGQRYDLDVDAAVAELRRRGASKVVTVGTSLGAGAVLISATRATVAGVVAVSGFSDFLGLKVLVAMPKLTAPVLLAASKQDFTAGTWFAGDARKLYAAAKSRDKTLLLVAGSAHGASLLPDAKVQAALTAFLEAHTK